MSLGETLSAIVGSGQVRMHVPLGPFTTFKVGGPADWFVEPRSADEVLQVLVAAHDAGVPVTMLGGGSNLLVGDKGIRGLVIRPRGGTIAQPGPGLVRADAAVTINGLVRWTIGRGLAGLEAWAGTPGTVGGGVFGNAHYGGRLLGEVISTVAVASREGRVSEVLGQEMEFGYDRSRLQRTGEVLLWADFRVSLGQPDELRARARASLRHRKATQPLETPSAGCVFQNPSSEETPAGLPRSAGALIDRAGMKGAHEGGARVSTTHANFIVNEGGATAADIRALIEQCRVRVESVFGVRLREEIVYVGEF